MVLLSGWYGDRDLFKIPVGSIDSRIEHTLLLILSTETKYILSNTTHTLEMLKAIYTLPLTQENDLGLLKIPKKVPFIVKYRQKTPIKMQKGMEIKYLPLFALY